MNSTDKKKKTLLRNMAWQGYQANYLITPDASFGSLDALAEAASRNPESIPSTHIAPRLSDPLDILRIEQGQLEGHWYSRFGSLPEQLLVRKLAELEAGYSDPVAIGGLITDSGMSAITQTLEWFAASVPFQHRKGKRFLAGNTLYSQTRELLDSHMQDYGLEGALHVDTTNLSEVKRALTERASELIGVFIEPISNPLIERTDLRAITQMAHAVGKPVIVDNTLLTPYGQQAFRLGADVVIHSLSKYMGGDGKSNGGVILTAHRVAKALRTRRSMHGGILSPDACMRIYHLLPDFPREMERYVSNARALAESLTSVDSISSVNYHTVCPDTRGGSGAVFSFNFKGASPHERQHAESKFVTEIANGLGPIQCKTSFGDGRYGALGQSTFGWEVPDNLKGIVRLSAGLGDVSEAISHMHSVFDRVSRAM